MRKLAWGPGLLVTAAFIGPGTVTTASKAGAEYGFALLWVVVLAILATIGLQSMAARLGLVARMGLGEALMSALPNYWLRVLAAGLVIAAIGFGNAAYQTGNLTGARLGLEIATGWSLQWGTAYESLGGASPGIATPARPSFWPAIMGGLAFALLFTGVYKTIERVLVAFVVLMSLTFIFAAVFSVSDWPAVVQGLVIPRVPSSPPGVGVTILALVGTTIVPYNLFLHASAVQKKWDREQSLDQSLWQSQVDSAVAISLGGLMTGAIVISAAVAFFFAKVPFANIGGMAEGLSPFIGKTAARWLFGIGLFAAGMTSAITAPLAAAYATSGVLGWKPELTSNRFRAIWIVVLVAGTTMATWMPRSPEQMIVIAQAANGLLLPLMIGFLLFVVNRAGVMGKYRAGWRLNLIGGLVWVLSIVLTANTFLKLVGWSWR